MKIYTKTGDAGTTSLAGGTRVSKTHPRVMAYGDLDELISHLGVLRCQCGTEEEVLRKIQTDLMLISAHFASDRELAKVKPLDAGIVSWLEGQIDRLTALLPEQKAFVLPAGPLPAAQCHIARTVCRRAERSALLIEDLTENDELGRRYINRLSDYLFTLARYLCVKEGLEEDFWLP